MPFIPTPAIVSATLLYLHSTGVQAINRLYCGAADVPLESDLEETADALYDVWVAQIMPTVSNSWELTGIRVRAMNVAEGLEFEDTNTYPVVGGVTSTLPPANNVSYTVTLNTGLAGRSARGRVYGVGLDNAWHNGNRLTDSSQGVLQSAWELVLDAMETAGHAINVVSFFEADLPRAEGRPLPVVSLAVRFPLASQRRRLS